MITLTANHKKLRARVALPASKSESNRALIMQALSQDRIELENLSSARDTQTLIRLLASEGHVLDVIDAGTTMRFLTAYCAAVGRDQILTGTPRMCKRPIGVLVDALRTLGAEIEYWKQEGYPPLHIISKGSSLAGGAIHMPGNVSSQFVTALLMIGPVLPGGLRIQLEGDIYSRPYIDMTLRLMRHFGVSPDWEDERILYVPEEPYQATRYRIESDWSAASYWYSMAALAEEADIFLLGLRKDSLQGDAAIAELMQPFGVQTEYHEDGVRLSKVPVEAVSEVAWNYADTPDLAQTVAVVSAATGIPVRMWGLESLRIKETDRIQALQTELAKFGLRMAEDEPGYFSVKGQFMPATDAIETYEDHRMAMAFAPLALRQPGLQINDPEVVEKSYPEFWDHLKEAGIRIEKV